LQKLNEEDFDVVILDLTLPDSSGLDTFTRVRDEFTQMPIVILTANNNKTDAIETVKHGAQDYIVKEHIENMQLALSVRYAIERKKAEETIKRANQELESFAHIVSHDLKAPLRGISNIITMLTEELEDKLTDDTREMADLLVQQVGRMQNLINGILQYSKVGRTSGEETVDIDLNELLATARDMVSPPDHIRIEIQPDLPTVMAEETRLSQVFMNLLSNAIKYMDKPQGLIKITCQDEGKFWRFSVSDNGPGIEPEHFDRIFGMFQTLKPKNEYDSTGVGLALIKKIVEMYHGKIWIESTVGEGSTFHFTFPKALQPAQEKLQTAAT
jgi:signal transduction histidine kinase